MKIDREGTNLRRFRKNGYRPDLESPDRRVGRTNVDHCSLTVDILKEVLRFTPGTNKIKRFCLN